MKWLNRAGTAAAIVFVVLLLQFLLVRWAAQYLEDWLAEPVNIASLLLFLVIGLPSAIVAAIVRLIQRIRALGRLFHGGS